MLRLQISCCPLGGDLASPIGSEWLQVETENPSPVGLVATSIEVGAKNPGILDDPLAQEFFGTFESGFALAMAAKESAVHT